MGILKQILDTIIDIGYAIGGAIKSLLGFKPTPPRAKIRAELRAQWLALGKGEKDIPGVEWEGEIYYETPK
jgi:hypothetical protein